MHEKFSIIISLGHFSVTLFFSSASWMTGLLDFQLWSLRSVKLSSFFSVYFLAVAQTRSFILFYLPGHWSSLCPLHSAVESIHWVFYLTQVFIWFFVICWDVSFHLCQVCFQIALWSIFMLTTLKSLSDNSNISVILVLTCIDFFHSVEIFQGFGVWQKVFSWKLDILGIMLWGSGLNQTFCLAGFLLPWSGGRKGCAASLLQGRGRSQVPHWVFSDRAKGVLFNAGHSGGVWFHTQTPPWLGGAGCHTAAPHVASTDTEGGVLSALQGCQLHWHQPGKVWVPRHSLAKVESQPLVWPSLAWVGWSRFSLGRLPEVEQLLSKSFLS